MIDDLDLSFEDDYDRGRHRRRRRGGGRAPQKRQRRRGRSFFALVLVLILLGGLAAGGWYGFTKVRGYFTVQDYPDAGTGEVNVEINNGDGGTDIANVLVTHDVVHSAKAFVNAYNANPNAQKVEPGLYKLHHHMKASLAMDALLVRDGNGRLVNKASNMVTIAEGMISLQIFQKLSEATKIPVGDFQNAAKDPVALGVPDWWFKRGDGKPVTPSIEGFLFPATYEFDPGTDATTILKKMVAQFLDVTGGLKFADTVQGPTLSISPYEALIAASITQVEAVFAADMPGVARVLYNRAYKTFACNCLGLDSTVNYWLRVTGKEPLDSGQISTQLMHDPTNPYNTYDKPGLPPGPISNPGKDALTAAMTAPKSDYYYFLAIDKAGHTAFATNLADFCAKTHQAKANGVSIGVCNG
jgi:UPF0755 protein